MSVSRGYPAPSIHRVAAKTFPRKLSDSPGRLVGRTEAMDGAEFEAGDSYLDTSHPGLF